MLIEELGLVEARRGEHHPLVLTLSGAAARSPPSSIHHR
jgi:hypothetical protein